MYDKKKPGIHLFMGALLLGGALIGRIRYLYIEGVDVSYALWSLMWCGFWGVYLTHKQLEMLVCVFSTVAADALVLKHQAIRVISQRVPKVHFCLMGLKWLDQGTVG